MQSSRGAFGVRRTGRGRRSEWNVPQEASPAINIREEGLSEAKAGGGGGGRKVCSKDQN